MILSLLLSNGAIQLCQQRTPHQAVFPNKAVCIDNELYAVYWSRTNLNGWLSQMPSGYYGSDQTGLECSFYVYPNCVIIKG